MHNGRYALVSPSLQKIKKKFVDLFNFTHANENTFDRMFAR